MMAQPIEHPAPHYLHHQFESRVNTQRSAALGRRLIEEGVGETASLEQSGE